jgi:hypothetical protein
MLSIRCRWKGTETPDFSDVAKVRNFIQPADDE